MKVKIDHKYLREKSCLHHETELEIQIQIGTSKVYNKHLVFCMI